MKYTPEKYLTPDYFKVEELKEIIKNAENRVCKIELNNKKGTGFLCKIPFPDTSNLLPVLFTCNHIIDQNDIDLNETIHLIFDNDNLKKIQLDKSRRLIYTKKDYDITVIEIIDNFDENCFMEVDDSYIYRNEKKNAYLVHYPKGEKLHIFWYNWKQ